MLKISKNIRYFDQSERFILSNRSIFLISSSKNLIDLFLEKGIEKKKRLFPGAKGGGSNKKKKKEKKVCKDDIARSFNQVEREKLYALASRRITAADHCTKKSISHCGSKKLFELKAFPCATKLFLLDRRSTSFEQRNDI